MMNIPANQKCKYFDVLIQSTHSCDLCNRMGGRKKVLSSENGNINSKVMFIAEAPGRLGAECTGIPLYGDKAGDNFESLLSNIGWNRTDVFITNAVLCNPQDDSGNNATPDRTEIANCNYYLKMTIALVNPDVIVTIGAKALDALNLVFPHTLTLRDSVAIAHPWNGRLLFPLYHTGSRAMIHRSQMKQRADFIALSHLVSPREGIKRSQGTIPRKASGASRQITPALVDMVAIILDKLRTVSFFKLTKLLYLIDCSHYEQFGNTISGGIYLRMQEGPWIPYLKEIAKNNDGHLFTTSYLNKKPVWTALINEYEPSNLSAEEICFIAEKCRQYANCSDAQMKTAAYLTKPMKYILTQEGKKRQMTRIPVLYKDKTVIEMDAVQIDEKTQ